MRYTSLLPGLLVLGCVTAWADEGMWTVDNFPTALVKERYGVEITPQWLERVRLSTIRLAYCTASFVSPDGLILTNHHCVARCLAEHSSKDTSLIETGFLAQERSKERRCGVQVADVLVALEDITAKVHGATRDLKAEAANQARKQTLTALEERCEESARSAQQPLKCEAVTLYGGGRYALYKYKRYDDVRLVFAPEAGIAAFGGDPDNFQFPRWCLDGAMLRAYEHGKPARTPNYLRIDFDGPANGQPVFVAGHPMSTDRLLTAAQLKSIRNVELPPALLRASELRGRYIQFARTEEQAERIVHVPLSGLEDRLKIGRNLLDALQDDALIDNRVAEEEKLRKFVARDADLSKELGDPWAQIERAQASKRTIGPLYTFLEGASSEAPAGFDSRLFRYARLLVRGAAERPKGNAERIREFTDAALPRVEQELHAAVPVYSELEQITLSLSLERMRESLGHDHPLVRRLLASESPLSLAASLIARSKLANPDVRLALWEGGEQAVAASDDAMIGLARSVDTEARAIRKRYEDEVEAPVALASAGIARARFAAFGTTVYPDATFTLRINFGAVQGWGENGKVIQPFTRLERMFERATGRSPFAVPARWNAAKDRLDLATPFNLSTTNDIVAGNSGSPLIDANGRIVGLIFDGNIHSIANRYHFDPQKSRGIAVHPAIIREALTKVYRAQSLLDELRITN
jgi:hypothetical protein